VRYITAILIEYQLNFNFGALQLSRNAVYNRRSIYPSNMRAKNILRIDNLNVWTDKKKILKGISLTVRSGEIHAIMGPNGSGKSTFAYAIMGHPHYICQTLPITSGIEINGKDISMLACESRAKLGLFLTPQSPVAIQGVDVVNLLRTAYQEIYCIKQKKQDVKIQNPFLSRRWNISTETYAEFQKKLYGFASTLGIQQDLLSRGINDGCSGGEKKKIEMLQALVLSPKFAIFDEIDTGLDVDALKIIAKGIMTLNNSGTGVIIITHYQRILKYIKPHFVHVMVNGKIVRTGSSNLAREIEEKGYKAYEKIRD